MTRINYRRVALAERIWIREEAVHRISMNVPAHTHTHTQLAHHPPLNGCLTHASVPVHRKYTPHPGRSKNFTKLSKVQIWLVIFVFWSESKFMFDALKKAPLVYTNFSGKIEKEAEARVSGNGVNCYMKASISRIHHFILMPYMGVQGRRRSHVELASSSANSNLTLFSRRNTFAPLHKS